MPFFDKKKSAKMSVFYVKIVKICGVPPPRPPGVGPTLPNPGCATEQKYRKMINFAKSLPQYRKMVNFTKSPPPPPNAEHRFD